LLFFLINYVSAELPPPAAKVNIDFSQVDFPEGDWRIHIIPSHFYSSEENFELLMKEYISTKKVCGTEDYDIWYRFNPDDKTIEEISSHHPSILEGTSNGIFYKFFINDFDKENYGICFPYGGFKKYHYVKSMELKREHNLDFREIYPRTCELIETKCSTYTFQEEVEDNTKYYFVLDKMNSTEDTYFSKLVSFNITEEIEWDLFELNNYTLYVDKLELISPNILQINLAESKQSDIFEENYWLIGIISICLLLIIVIFYKFKK